MATKKKVTRKQPNPQDLFDWATKCMDIFSEYRSSLREYMGNVATLPPGQQPPNPPGIPPPPKP